MAGMTSGAMATALNTSIAAALQGVTFANSAAFAQALATGIANGLVPYLQGNAVVDPAGSPTPLTAPSMGGPVTGTGKLD